MKTFKEYTETPILYTLYSKDDFNPQKFGLPSNVTKYVGEGASSIVFSSNTPNSPVYKISRPLSVGHDPAEKLKDRTELVASINQLEAKGRFTIPDAYMHWGTYLHQNRPPQPKEAYYDKETKSWTIDRTYPIKATNTTILTGGIIKQDRVVGKPVDERLYRMIVKILTRNGFYVDRLGGRRNILLTDAGEIAIIDGISYIGI